MRPGTAGWFAATVATFLGFAALGHRAEAYPQFQMSRDQLCTGCHLSPAGGTLLNENGTIAAESMSQFGTNPTFFYNKIPLPDWLELGGDLRGIAGYLQTPEKSLDAIPMQLEIYANAALPGGFSLRADVGYRATEFGNEAATYVWSREHYVMWQQRPGEGTGLFLRLGRFMPVFGLRLAEHDSYIRRYGGTPLYGETYGVAAEYLTHQLEVHATGFIKDPLIDTPEHSNGGALLGEYRITERVSVGAEAMYQQSADDKKIRAGVLGKLYMPSVDVLVSGEFQFINQIVNTRGAPRELLGYLMGSKFLGNAFLLDVGLGHYDENIRIKYLDRDSVDVNFHWFSTSHLELVLNGRIEMIGLGKGGPTGAYAFAQAHYRL